MQALAARRTGKPRWAATGVRAVAKDHHTTPNPSRLPQVTQIEVLIGFT